MIGHGVVAWTAHVLTQGKATAADTAYLGQARAVAEVQGQKRLGLNEYERQLGTAIQVHMGQFRACRQWRQGDFAHAGGAPQLLQHCSAQVGDAQV